MQNKINDGKRIKYACPDAVKGGDIVVIGEMVGVASADYAANELGVYHPEGVFELAKDAAAIAVGKRVYLGVDGKITAEVGDLPAGIAWMDAAAGATTVEVKINV
ncbi:DUF2190 family protein [Desulfovibrio sp. OttesenSCG-928-C06]|nr:DUF2190 family protein [Desulfovibrio sp. OttesenSCG-928-C06]